MTETRIATEGDIAAILKITHQYRNELGYVNAAALRENMARQTLIVAVRDDMVIGFCNYRACLDGWQTVYEIAVHRDFKKQGVGSEILANVPNPVRLKCTTDNPANAFYEAMGFTHQGIDQGKKRPLNIWHRIDALRQERSVKLPTLPHIDMRPVCPLCKQPANVLGQFSPRVSTAICKDCTLSQRADSSLLLQWDEATFEQRAALVAAESHIRESLPKRYTPPRGLQSPDAWRTLAMPFCQECGCIHDHKSPFNGVAYDRCLVCETRYQVRMAYQSRHDNPVFKIKSINPDDAESVLDMLYRFHRDWFECRVLPDYWFELRSVNATTKTHS